MFFVVLLLMLLFSGLCVASLALGISDAIGKRRNDS